MLTKCDIVSESGQRLSLPLFGSSNQFLVHEIEGLDPVKSTISSSVVPGIDGELFHSSRRETRNIKIRLGLSPDYESATVKDLRKRLYSYVMPGNKVRLDFFDSGGQVLRIQSEVETMETLLFSQDPMVDISLLSSDPNFYDPSSVVLTINPPFGVPLVVNYDGDVPTGVKLTFVATGNVSSFTFRNTKNGNSETLTYAGDITNGNRVTIITTPGSREVLFTSNALDEVSRLSALDPLSKWPRLYPGENTLMFNTNTQTGGEVTIEYTTKYGGM